MYILNFNEPCKLHFTGIGGISMSALAEIMLSRHFTVTGSDNQNSQITAHLESLGAKIFYGQRNLKIRYTHLSYSGLIKHYSIFILFFIALSYCAICNVVLCK